jgi:tRNA-(ms[2]io[6]A)-hydroxylase
MDAVFDFLVSRTPVAWCEAAIADLELLLLDHATLELKAAHQAQRLIWKYGADRGGVFPDRGVQIDLLQSMSRLAREELRHYEQVLALLEKLGIVYKPLSASGYAAALHEHVRTGEPERLIDTLIVGALIEARSCERFHALIPYLQASQPELARFYRSLLRSEARHFADYLKLAEAVGGPAIAPRVDELRAAEGPLLEAASPALRFHSGIARGR